MNTTPNFMTFQKNLGSPLQPKKAKQIDGKLQSIKKVAKGFEALYKKQVELNWFWLDIGQIEFFSN